MECERMQEREKLQIWMCASEQGMEETKQAVKSAKAQSSLFLTLNRNRSTESRLKVQTLTCITSVRSVQIPVAFHCDKPFDYCRSDC